MALYDTDPNDLAVASAEYAWVQQQASQLRARAYLDPRDPEALDETELARLESLEAWQP